MHFFVMMSEMIKRHIAVVSYERPRLKLLSEKGRRYTLPSVVKLEAGLERKTEDW